MKMRVGFEVLFSEISSNYLDDVESFESATARIYGAKVSESWKYLIRCERKGVVLISLGVLLLCARNPLVDSPGSAGLGKSGGQ